MTVKKNFIGKIFNISVIIEKLDPLSRFDVENAKLLINSVLPLAGMMATLKIWRL